METLLDFLGKNIRKYNGKLLINPSKTAIKAFLGKVRDIIKSNKSTKQETLIRKLNPVIRGWVNNQRFVVSSEIFGRVDHEVYKCLWQWAKRRHKKKGHKWIAAKYWHHIGNRQWTFSAPVKAADGTGAFVKLEYATDTKIIRFKKIVAESNAFDAVWTEYFEEREGEKMLNSTKGREKLLAILINDLVGKLYQYDFLPAFRAVKRVVFQNAILSNPVTGFTAAERTAYPF